MSKEFYRHKNDLIDFLTTKVDQGNLMLALSILLSHFLLIRSLDYSLEL